MFRTIIFAAAFGIAGVTFANNHDCTSFTSQEECKAATGCGWKKDTCVERKKKKKKKHADKKAATKKVAPAAEQKPVDESINDEHGNEIPLE